MIKTGKILYQYRDLVIAFVRRDFATRFHQTVFGVMWVLINPLATVIVVSVVFSSVFANSLGVPYPLFVLLGLVVWQYFSVCIASASQLLVSNAPLITKAAFPKIVLVASLAIARFLDLAIISLIFVLLLIVYRQPIGTTALATPLILLTLMLTTVGLSVLVAISNVYFRDVSNLIPIVLLLLLYATPVFYPEHIVLAKFAFLFHYNPLAILIEQLRQVILYRNSADLVAIFIVLIISIALLQGSLMLFKKLEPTFADRL